MLPPDQSPLIQLVLPWWKDGGRYRPLEAHGLRKQLFAAALAEMDAADAGEQPQFDPLINPVFRWAVQYLEHTEGMRPKIDSDIKINASVYLNPTPFLEIDFDADEDET